MTYYAIKVENGNAIDAFLKDLLDVAVRTGDIIGDWKACFNSIQFKANRNNNIEGKLIRNGYEVSKIEA